MLRRGCGFECGAVCARRMVWRRIWTAGGARGDRGGCGGAAFEEALFLGLRMNVGVSLEELEAEFGRARVEAVMPVVREMVAGGLLVLRGERVRLTARGGWFRMRCLRSCWGWLGVGGSTWREAAS